jgi:hypothetical protein
MFIILQLDDSYNAAHGSGSRSQVEGESTSPGRKRKRVGTSKGRGKSSSTAQPSASQPSAAPSGLASGCPTSQPSAAIVKTSYHVISFHIEIHYATLMCFYSDFFFFPKYAGSSCSTYNSTYNIRSYFPTKYSTCCPKWTSCFPTKCSHCKDFLCI